MSHDPYPGNPQEPVTLHRYLYANANPVMYTDPSGKMSLISDITATIAIRSMLASVFYSGTGHLAGFIAGKNPVRWSGGVIARTGGSSLWGVGGMIVGLESELRRCLKISTTK